MVTDERQAEFGSVRDSITAWASTRADCTAVALVGSWASNAATMNSDVDVVVLTTDARPYIEHEDWVPIALGRPGTISRTMTWGPLTERRVLLESHLEVDVGFVDPSWADVDPVDAGTASVVSGGCDAWYDPQQLLATLIQSC